MFNIEKTSKKPPLKTANNILKSLIWISLRRDHNLFQHQISVDRLLIELHAGQSWKTLTHLIYPPVPKYTCCMPVKSRPHRSNLPLAGHLASPSGNEPFDWSPHPAVRLLAERRSGTEPPVTTGGARRRRKGLKHWYKRQWHKGRDPHFDTHTHR